MTCSERKAFEALACRLPAYRIERAPASCVQCPGQRGEDGFWEPLPGKATHGTLGVSREAPVGFKDIRLQFDLETDAPADQISKLLELTERYCVVYQTLKNAPGVTVSHQAN